MDIDGVLADIEIKELIAKNHFSGSVEAVESEICELHLSREGCRVPGIPLPGSRECMTDYFKRCSHEFYDFSFKPEGDYFVLEKGTPYLFRLKEECGLPNNISAEVSGKSSIARCDIKVDILTDVPDEFNQVPAGYGSNEKKPLWAVITSYSFPVRVYPGDSIAQILFKRGNNVDLKEKEINRIHNLHGLQKETDIVVRDDKVVIELAKAGSVWGYHAKPGSLLDLRGKNQDWKKFWEVIPDDNELVLRRGEFYLIITKNQVALPNNGYPVCGVLDAMDAKHGDFRAHYAAFVHAGHGYNPEGQLVGSRLAMELRPLEDLVAGEGCPIARMRILPLTRVPEKPYCQRVSSNNQGELLAKYFTRP